jgi:hypothetical protein
MPDLPAAAIQAAAAAIERELMSGTDYSTAADSDEALARAALTAAAPLLAENLLAPLIKRHAPVASEWGGFYCGTCWTKASSHPTWPCSETLAIAELLPSRQASELAPEVGEDGKHDRA